MDVAARLRTAGLLCGLTVGLVLGTGIAPPVFVGSLVLGVVLGELALPRPERGLPVSATLEVRRMRDYLPRTATRGVVATAATVVAVIAVIGLIGLLDRPDMPADYFDSGWYGPFSEYGRWAGHGFGGLFASMLLTILATLVLAGLVLRLIVGRPRADGDTAQREKDEAWRRRVATTVVASLGVVVSVHLTVVSFLVASTFTEDVQGVSLFALLPTAVGVAALLGFVGYASMLMRQTGSAAAPAFAPSLAANVTSVEGTQVDP